jgi:hypothetical protein
MTAAVLTAVLAVVMLPLGLWIGADALLNESSGNEVDTSVIDVPLTPAELLFVVGARGELASVALLALDPSGAGGTIVSLPARLAADIDKGDTPRSVADAYAAGGLAAARLEVEDILNITATIAAEVTSEQLTALIAPMGSATLTLAAPVLDGPAADATTVLPAGQTSADAAKVAAGLSAVQSDVAESKRFNQVKELWAAVATGGADAPAVETGDDGDEPDAPDSSESFFAWLFAGRIDVWQIEATIETDAVRNPSGADWYRLDAAETLLVVASTVPTAMSIATAGVTVMLDIPFDDAELAKEAVTRLAYLEANIMVVRRVEGPPAAATKVYFNDLLARDEVAQYESLIGPMEFEQATEVVSGISVRMVLGSDFAALVSAGGGGVSTTVPG